MERKLYPTVQTKNKQREREREKEVSIPLLCFVYLLFEYLTTRNSNKYMTNVNNQTLANMHNGEKKQRKKIFLMKTGKTPNENVFISFL